MCVYNSPRGVDKGRNEESAEWTLFRDKNEGHAPSQWRGGICACHYYVTPDLFYGKGEGAGRSRAQTDQMACGEVDWDKKVVHVITMCPVQKAIT